MQQILSKMRKAIEEYNMIDEGDKIAVCLSGGKDSMLMAKLFQLLEKFKIYDFEAKYLVMNPGYNEINLQTIKNNLEILHIPAQIIETNIFEVANSQDKSPCYLCARMRRGNLYALQKKWVVIRLL